MIKLSPRLRELSAQLPANPHVRYRLGARELSPEFRREICELVEFSGVDELASLFGLHRDTILDVLLIDQISILGPNWLSCKPVNDETLQAILQDGAGSQPRNCRKMSPTLKQAILQEFCATWSTLNVSKRLHLSRTAVREVNLIEIRRFIRAVRRP